MTRSKYSNCYETILFSHGKTKLNTYSKSVKQHSVMRLQSPTNLRLGSIIFMIVSSSILATARQQPECSSRH